VFAACVPGQGTADGVPYEADELGLGGDLEGVSPARVRFGGVGLTKEQRQHRKCQGRPDTAESLADELPVGWIIPVRYSAKNPEHITVDGGAAPLVPST
jgi:hypothetical protein